MELKAKILKRNSGFELALDKEGNKFIGEALIWKGGSEAYCIALLEEYLEKGGMDATIIVLESTGSGISMQEESYIAYKKNGGVLPLSIYLGN